MRSLSGECRSYKRTCENRLERLGEMRKFKMAPEFSFLIFVIILWCFSVIIPLKNPGSLHIFVAINVYLLVNFFVIFYFWYNSSRTTTLLRFAFFVMDRKSLDLLQLDEDYNEMIRTHNEGQERLNRVTQECELKPNQEGLVEALIEQVVFDQNTRKKYDEVY